MNQNKCKCKHCGDEITTEAAIAFEMRCYECWDEIVNGNIVNQNIHICGHAATAPLENEEDDFNSLCEYVFNHEDEEDDMDMYDDYSFADRGA